MIQVLVASVMWTLVASLLILRRGRTDRSVTYAAVAIAFAMTLNVDDIYLAIDPALSGTNLVTVASDALLMTGLFFLGRGVMRAGDYRPQPVKIAVGLPALVVALTCVAVLFFFIDRGETTTEFMRDLGAHPAAAIYSITVFAYCGIVVAAMLVLAVRQFRLASGVFRVPAMLLAVGAGCGIALCVNVIIMDVAHVTGALSVMYAVDPAYGPLMIATFLFLCAGFIAQPAMRSLRQRLRDVQTDVLVAQLDPIWRDATSLRPGLSGSHPTPGILEEPEARLHRNIVEIRDAMIDPRVTFAIDDAERTLLERAESHLLGLKAPKMNRRKTDDVETKAESS